MVAIPVTYLELTAPPTTPPLAPTHDRVSTASERLGLCPYMELWREVGAPWDWNGRSQMTDGAIAAVLASPETDIYVLRHDGVAVGFCEFNRPDPPDSEIKYFGLLPTMQGRRLGPYLLDFALREHWRRFAPRRIWLHTDTGDHGRAIATYEHAGFRTFAVRILDDDAQNAEYRAAIGLPRRD